MKPGNVYKGSWVVVSVTGLRGAVRGSGIESHLYMMLLSNIIRLSRVALQL